MIIKKRPIAIVIPWFGRELAAGAELHAWNLATRLTERNFDVEVLTTCCRSFGDDWSTNFHKPGLYEESERLKVRRFLVVQRNRAEFDRVCSFLLNLDKSDLKPGVSPVPDSDEEIFTQELIKSPELLNYLENNSAKYAAFMFLPYLYGPILNGLPKVASRSILVPCLHEESYAYLHTTQNIFYKAKHILWLSEGEFELGQGLYGPGIINKSLVAGAGVETEQLSKSPTKIPKELKGGVPFVLNLGRKDPGKGTFFLIEAFRAFKKKHGTKLTLVIAGPGDFDCNDPDNGILDLGFVSNELRHWLLKHAVTLAQPSKNESFSRVIFEAWFLNKPVIARRSCLATACAVRASGGGWVAEDEEEWISIFAELTPKHATKLTKFGGKGKKYSEKIADWKQVIDRYEEILSPMCEFQTLESSFIFSFDCLIDQTITIQFGEETIGELIIQAHKLNEYSLKTSHPQQEGQILSIKSCTDGTIHTPDPRKLGFRLVNLTIENEQLPSTHMIFSKGWHRSEGLKASDTPRWSTGNAEILVSFGKETKDKSSVHQVLPNLGYGDAIGNHALWIRDRLQSQGHHSEIFARHIASPINNESYAYTSSGQIPEEAAIIYHHSIGSEITPWVCAHKGPKALIYHNITPPSFFEPYSKTFTNMLEQGHNQLGLLADHFPSSAGDSKFNAADLRKANFKNPGVIPLSIDPSKWSYEPDEQVMAEYQDGRTNIIFVGRVVPNKRHEELIYLLKFWLIHDPTSRLIFVGSNDITSTYLNCLKLLAQNLRVDHAIVYTGHVNDAQLLAYYRTATIFWCLSDHEGFCVPVIEAMWFDIPVVAYDSTAVGGTMGNAGVLIKDKSRPDLLAETLHKQLTDPVRLEEIISSQRKRRVDFLPESNGDNIDKMITTLTRDKKSKTTKK